MVRQLNTDAEPGSSYKFFLLARHGQGYHNVAELKYGTKAWDDHWAALNDDGELTWGPDPLLTSLGQQQVSTIRNGLTQEVALGLPAPQRRFCSPLSRALDTCDIMFEGTWQEYPRPVMVLEDCREENGVHTCDKRRSRSYIAGYKPHFSFEEGFAEFDDLWHPNTRETKGNVAQRARKVLEMIFETATDDTFITITSHEGFIHGFLTAAGRKVFKLPTGGIVPVLVKSTVHRSC
ncbi:histidine phosphatase superfamily [Gymnopilus junonius]|uniref:Histidine phosphatase superfamily n=1 Tax=Gymnopilus junonius TaxID=109634 RepID=A0A9P5NQA8_GYMJU|nr:histidine phosphatase superfamily [Gymnopilus junonius]